MARNRATIDDKRREREANRPARKSLIMAFTPTPNAVRSSLRMTLHGENVINTLWHLLPSPAAAADLQAINTYLIAWWSNNIAANLSEDIVLVEVTSIAQDSSSAPSVSVGTVVEGGIIGGALPGNCCITLKFNTNARGRTGRGRNYISGLRETDVQGNQIDAARAEALRAGYDMLRTGTPPIVGMNWILASFQQDGVPRGQGQVRDIIGVQVVNLDIDSQRRRLTGRGT